MIPSWLGTGRLRGSDPSFNHGSAFEAAKHDVMISLNTIHSRSPQVLARYGVYTRISTIFE